MKTQNEIKWPANCQFGKGLDGLTVMANRELLRRELGVAQPATFQRNRVRLSSDANGKTWTTSNGG